MIKGSQQRIRWIDAVRTIAIIFVVLCHACDTVYSLPDLYNMNSRSFVFVCQAFGRLGVPLFLFLSGYLLLDREYDEVSIRRFWIHKWLVLLGCTGIWFVIYEVFLWMIGKGESDLLVILQHLTFTRLSNMSHAWYMGMILGLYMFLPFIAMALRKLDKKVFVLPFVMFFLYTFVYDTVNSILTVFCPEYQMENVFGLAFSGGVWLLYLVTGYYLKQGILKGINTPFLAILFVVSLSLIYLFMLIPSFEGFINRDYIWYDSVPVFLSSVLGFELLSRIKIPEGSFYSIIRFIAKYSFSIYLTHNLVIMALYPLIDGLNVYRSVKTIILLIAGFLIGLGISWLLARIPKAGRFITYVKE